MYPQKKERTPARPNELHPGCNGCNDLATGVTLGVLATVAGFLILPPEALGQDSLQSTLIVALALAAMVAELRFSAILTFFGRRKNPAGLKAAMATSNSGRTADAEQYRLRNGDGIPHPHLWWF